MNLARRLSLCIRNMGARYARGEVTVEEMVAYRMRFERLQDRMKWLKTKNEINARRARRWAEIKRVREVIERGGTIAAFDTEFNNDGPVEQLGISIWQNGEITTHTYTLHHLYDWYRTRQSLYGGDSTVSREEIKRIARETYAAADMNVFHSYGSDAEKLGLHLAVNRYVDTSRLSHFMHVGERKVPGLKDICAHYGIELQGHHNAGNDAYHTLKALLAIVSDPVDDWFAESPERAAQQAEQRRIIMSPTRLPVPDPEALEAHRKRAQEAYRKLMERMKKSRIRSDKRFAKRAANASAPETPRAHRGRRSTHTPATARSAIAGSEHDGQTEGSTGSSCSA